MLLQMLKSKIHCATVTGHNHPSGTCVPSHDDIEATKSLIEASILIGIPILDHIIFDCDSYYSFLEHDFLFKSDVEALP